jgi:hypothetical protein
MELMLTLGSVDERRRRVNYGTFRAKVWLARALPAKYGFCPAAWESRSRGQVSHAAVGYGTS